MLRNVMLRALSFVAIVAAICLMSLQANAAIVPVCDADAFSGIIAIAAAPARLDCEDPASPNDDNTIDPQVAAMCDAQGATVVAPGRIHPMSDAVIDAVVNCDGTNVGPLVTASQGEDGQATSSWATVHQAILVDSYNLRPCTFVELVGFPPVEGNELPEFGREIYHPPRAA